jgi:hypothetical protein
MTERVQVLLKPEEKIRLQRQAQREGTSLSAWLRQVALERLAQGTVTGRFARISELREHFKRCSAREQGQEPDWETQRDVIDQSRRTGTTNT